MLKQRIITALWGVPLLLAVIWFGEPWFSLVMAAATSLGALEFYRMAAHSQKQPLATFGIIWSLLFLLSPHISDPRVMPLLLASAITIPPIWLALRPPRQNFIYNYAWTVAGILYLGWALSHYVALRDTSQGME
jgi:phosphatidate cytidylyltransferase